VIQEFGEKCTLSRCVGSLDVDGGRAEERSGTRRGIGVPVRAMGVLVQGDPVPPAVETAPPANVLTDEAARHATEFPGVDQIW
jgi:hypothetical protein